MNRTQPYPGAEKGAGEALEQLEPLRVFAYRLSRDHQVTADLVQETMLRALRSLHTYQPGSNCRAWLFQICKNIHINNCRRRRYAVVSVDFQEDRGDEFRGAQTAHPRPPAGMQDTVQEQDAGLSDEIVDALDSLPFEYRTAVLLSDVESLPYEEIAAFTRAPLGTVRSRIHRGRRLLAKRLAPIAQQYGILASRRAA